MKPKCRKFVRIKIGDTRIRKIMAYIYATTAFVTKLRIGKYEEME